MADTGYETFEEFRSLLVEFKNEVDEAYSDSRQGAPRYYDEPATLYRVRNLVQRALDKFDEGWSEDSQDFDLNTCLNKADSSARFLSEAEEWLDTDKDSEREFEDELPDDVTDVRGYLYESLTTEGGPLWYYREKLSL